MKSVTAYYLMLLYVTVMVKPLLPLVSDWWSHEFNGIEHISVVHAQFGANHVQQEIAKEGGDRSNKSQTITKVDNSIPFHLSAESFHYNLPIKTTVNYQRYFLNTLPFTILSKNGPPPKSFV